MQRDSEKTESKILTQILTSLQDLEFDSRERILRTVATFFDLGHTTGVVHAIRSHVVVPNGRKESSGRIVDFSEDMAPSPKQFLMEKQPHTDVERVACLAYYLTHYRDCPLFKTLDLSKLNTEAAQPKFSNATYSAHNALNQRYLAQGGKGGIRQLSAAGEQFVAALPDREAAKAAMTRTRPRRARKSSKKTNSKKSNSSKKADK